MAQDAGSPSSRRYSNFICEVAEITDVNRKTWTCTAEGIYGSKTFENVHVLSPYHHYAGGEGMYAMPEVGARCYIASPNDNSPAFVMGFIAVPSVVSSATDDPLRSTMNGASSTDVSYQSKRPDANPGDMGFTTRDGSFFKLLRGGVIQLGSTNMAQRIYIPVRNFIKDFAENYTLSTVSGEVAWTVERPELDPLGKAACTYSFTMQEYGSDKKASVRVRHMPLQAAGAKKAFWEVTVAPQGIDHDKGSVSGATYTMTVLSDGTQTEMVGANREITVKGNDKLTIDGSATIEAKTAYSLKSPKITITADQLFELTSKAIKLGSSSANEPGVLGQQLLKWLSGAQFVVGPGVAAGSVCTLSPASVATLQTILSRTVFLK